MSEPEERVGPYVLEGVLGRGGMGIVHRARDPSGRAVALKRLIVRDAEVAARLAREADVRIIHPNVVRVLASGLDARGEPYVVTELLEGSSLDQALAVPHELRTVLRLFAEAADGLSAIHAAGIVHRDVKPSNLFVTKEGVLKILDFGVATFTGTSTQLTVTGALIGTPAYFSPEQARGDRVDARSDLWGLAMTLYEALTGELPFRRASVVGCALAVQNDPLPSLFDRPLAQPISLELAALVERCLAKKPGDRPSSAAELAEALRGVRAEGEGRPSQPLLAPPSETWRTVTVALVDGAAGSEQVETAARAAHAEAFQILGRTWALVFGRGTARGDELDRALTVASELAAREPFTIVIGVARGRSVGREIDAESLRPITELLDRTHGQPAVWLTEDVATLAGLSRSVIRGPEGARLAPSGGAAANVTSSPLIGRDAELSVLEDAAARAERGAMGHVLVVGDPGMGKTALVRTFIERLRRSVPEAIVRIGRAERSETAPFAALFDAFELTDDAPSAEAPALAIDRRHARVLDHLGEDLVRAPLVVLVLEEAQDADAATRAFLDELVQRHAERSLIVIETRPAADAAHTAITLGPLGSTAMGRLVERFVGRDRAQAIAEALTSRSGGNPRFAIHLAELALAKGVGLDVERWELPSTVESAIQSRLDALPEDLRGATHTLSVLGSEASLDEARWALGPSSDAWIHALAGLGVLETTSRQGRLRFRFKSRVVAEVAYAALDAATRVRIHRGLASRLASSTEVSPDLVLHHAERGGDDELEARFVELALLRAARIGDGGRVLDLLARMRAASHLTFAALFAAAEASAFVAGRGAPESLFEEALEAAQTPDERAAALVELGERARRSAQIVRARTLLERAIETAPRGAIAARATSRLALVRLSEGDAEAARELLDACVLDGVPPAAAALVWDTRGYVDAARGEIGARRTAYERAATLYAEAGDARRAAGASANLADTLRQIGELALAETALRRAIEGARRVGNGLTEAYACTNLAATLLAAGRKREAAATLEVASARTDAVGDERLWCVLANYRAHASERVLTSDERARIARANPDGADATLSVLGLGLVLAYGSPTDAELDEALALLERGDEIEEGGLELAAALFARRPSEHVRALITSGVERAHRTLLDPAARDRYVAHVARIAPEALTPWLAMRFGAR